MNLLGKSDVLKMLYREYAEAWKEARGDDFVYDVIQDVTKSEKSFYTWDEYCKLKDMNVFGEARSALTQA